MAPRDGMTVEFARELYGLQPRSDARPAPRPAIARPARLRHCHYCASPFIHREPPVDWFERWIMPLLGRRPYRCVDCGRRFVHRGRGPRWPGLRPGASPILPPPAHN